MVTAAAAAATGNRRSRSAECGAGDIDLDAVDNDVWRRTRVAAASMDDVTRRVSPRPSL